MTFKNTIVEWLSEKEFDRIDILDDYYAVILVAIFLSTLIFIGRQQSMNYRRIVWPSIISEVSFKIFLPIAVLLSIFSLLDLESYAYAYLAFLSFVVLALWVLLGENRSLELYLVNAEIWSRVSFKELRNYALFSSLSKMGIMLIFKLDAFMITLMLGASSNGIFFIFLFIASVIQIPFKSINLISSPIISQAWNNPILKNWTRFTKRHR